LEDDLPPGRQIAAQHESVGRRSDGEKKTGAFGIRSPANNPGPKIQELVLCTAREEKTKTGRWLFEISGIPNSKGRVDPRSIPNLPADLAPGMQITMRATRNGDGSYTLAIPSK
jgi:hypothetical protein